MNKDSSDESSGQHRAKEIAGPVREALAEILYEKLKDKSTRDRVAAELGYSPNTLRATIYSEKGSLDLMVAALITLNGWGEKDVASFTKRAIKNSEKANRSSKFEKRLRAIDETMSEVDKERLLTAIEIILSLNRSKI